MHKFEYEIRLNEEGRPYVHLPEEFEGIPEHLFMVMEMTRYHIYDLLDRNESKDDLTDESIIKIAEAGDTIRQISDKYADIIKGMMETKKSIDDLLNDEQEETD